MVETMCTDKIRDNQNRIIKYVLKDVNGQEQVFDAQYLKELIVASKVNVRNLTLTSDNRLVDAGDKAFEKYRGSVVTTPETPKTKLLKATEKIVTGLGFQFNMENASENGAIQEDGRAPGIDYRSEAVSTPCFGDIILCVQVDYEWRGNGTMAKNDLSYSVSLYSSDPNFDNHYAFCIEHMRFNMISLQQALLSVKKDLQRLKLDKNFYRNNRKIFDKMVSYLYKNKTYIDEITKEDFLKHYGANLV